jgi:YVTN family beta-propeller protein
MSGIDGRLRDLLEAAAGEPPRQVSVDAVRRKVVRRRLLEGIAGIAAVAVIAVAVPAVAVNPGHGPPASRTGTAHPRGPVVYVLNAENGTVTPILAATNKPDRPIRLTDDGLIAITPDGKTAYVASSGPGKSPGTVTPIDIAKQTAGAAIKVGAYPDAIAITPDGRTAYVSSGSGSVTPIDIRTQTARAAIKVGGEPTAMVMVP